MGTYYALMQRIHDVVKDLESTGDLESVFSAQEVNKKDSRSSGTKESREEEEEIVEGCNK